MNRFRQLTRILLALALLAPSIASAEGTPAPPPLLLAEVYSPEADPAAFWVSEKLDGARAYWDGRQLRFRSGRPVPAPDWFLAGLPPVPLDGELWAGRGRFDELSAIVRKTPAADAEWRRVRYMVFELPGGAGSFTERIEEMRRIVGRADVPWLQAVEQFRVADRAALKSVFDRIVKEGGEGLMLHRADAPYVTGRSPVLMKLKPWRDAEATVVGHEPGRGRLQGQLGALRVQTPEGKHFRLGTGFSDEARRHPPPVGSIVTYRYQELSLRGIPRFPVYLRVWQAF